MGCFGVIPMKTLLLVTKRRAVQEMYYEELVKVFGERLNILPCVQYDDGPWVRQLYLEGGGIRSATVAVRPKRCDHFRVKIAGIGQATLYSLTKDEETGSEET